MDNQQLEIEYQKNEVKRKLFYKWKRELRIYTADKLGSYKKRFNNPVDMNHKLIGMRILENEEINKVFQKWKQRETIKLERYKHLEKNKHKLIGIEKEAYIKLRNEYKEVA